MASDGTRLRVALVGTGGWSANHARYLAGEPGIDFRAIVGRTLATTTERAARFGTRPYIDVAEMIEREQPDLVVLSLPNQHHYERTMQVIEAGIPLIVEKPLAFSMAEADEMLREAERRNLFFAIDFNHRYAVPVERAIERVRAGDLGDLVFATWRFGGEGSSTHPHANLIETQCHGFDMLEYLAGPVSSVMAQMTEMPGKGQSTVSIALRFHQGAVGSLVGSYDSSYAYQDTHRLELNGTLGRIVISDTVRRFEYQQAGNETAEVWQAGYFNDRDRGFQRTLDRYMEVTLAAFRAGDPPPVHAVAGRRALELAQASIESFEEGRRVATYPVNAR